MAFWQTTLQRWIGRKGQQHLPLPGRGAGGQVADWWQMLSAWRAQAQPIKPADAREGKDNSVVSIAINWITTSWQVAPPQVGSLDAQGKFVAQPSHPLPALLLQPSADMDGTALLSGWITDYIRKGNAFGHIVTSAAGKPVGLDYLPAKLVKPVPDELGRLSHYEYQVNGETRRLEVPEVLHFRHGIDEDNPLLGVSPIAAQYREIVADNSFSDVCAGTGMNGATKQVVFTPRQTPDGGMVLTPEEAKEVSDKYHEYTRQFPGRKPFLSASVDVHTIGLSPSELALNDVRAMPETRIPAALGIPAILLQLYTGIQKSTYNNLAEAIQQGWRGGILPMMRVFEAVINQKLLPKFGAANRGAVRFRWDVSVVPELQDDTLSMREADREDVKAGILTADEARARQGLAAKPQEAALPAQTLSFTGTRRVLKVAGSGEAQDIYAVADAFRRALARSEADALDTLAVQWGRTERSLRKQINALQSEIAAMIAAGQTPEQWRQAALVRLEEIRAAVLSEMSDLGDRSAAAVADAQRAGIAAAADYTEPLARAAAGQAPAGKALPWKPLSVEAFEALVGFSGDGSPLSALLERFGTEEGAAILQALADGIILGENPRTVAARAATAMGGSRRRLEAIARTEMHRACREATRRTYAANSDVVSGYRRLSAADTRTCVACWALHGTLSTTAEIMPSHVNCRCVMVPELRSYAEILGDPTIPDTREEMLSGPDLFAMLPEADQLAVLGPGRLALYQEGKALSDLIDVEATHWGPTTREKPLAEVNN